MEGDLDFILQIHIGARQRVQQVGEVGREFIQQVRIHQVGHGWRRRQPSGRQ
jgi:hypothetical protein